MWLISLILDGQMLDKKTFDEKHGSSVFGQYDFTIQWITLILLLSMGVCTFFVVMVLTIASIVFQKGKRFT